MTDYTVWTKKDGTQIPVKEMTRDHIENCIKMMERNGYVSVRTLRFYLFGPQPNGDIAQLAYEQEQREIFDRAPNKWIDVLRDELASRKETDDSGSEGRYPIS